MRVFVVLAMMTLAVSAAQPAAAWQTKPSLNPCDGISEDGALAAFNAHGYRLGGPTGSLVTGTGVFGLHSTTGNILPRLPGFCSGYVATQVDFSAGPVTDFIVEKLPDGELAITMLAHFVP